MSNIMTVEEITEIATQKTRRKPKTMLEDFRRRYPHHVRNEHDDAPAFCVTFLSEKCNALCQDATGEKANCLECWKQPVPEGIR